MVLKSKITKKVIRNPNDEELLKKLKIKKEYFPETNEIFYIVLLNNNEIGSAVYRTNKNVVDSTGIDKEYRRKGINTWLYNYIEKDQGVKLIPSKTLMRDGELFWRNRLRRSNPRDDELLKSLNIIKYYDDNYNETYYRILNDENKEIARIIYDNFNKWISSSFVDVKYRRKGIANFIYDYIEKDQNIKLIPSAKLLKDGKEFWKFRLKKNPKPKPKPKNARPIKTSKTKTTR